MIDPSNSAYRYQLLVLCYCREYDCTAPATSRKRILRNQNIYVLGFEMFVLHGKKPGAREPLSFPLAQNVCY